MDNSQLHSSSGSSSVSMGEANEGSSSGSRSIGVGNLALEMSGYGYPRGLLQTFIGRNPHQMVRVKMEEEEEDGGGGNGGVELSLGLSLGGKFGLDKSHKRLMRSSSIAGTVPLIRGNGPVARPPVGVPSLARSSSLPLETEEEWRNRKELQALRRMEAKRRRSEKLRNMRENGEGRGGSGVKTETGLRIGDRLEVQQNSTRGANRLCPSASLPNWPVAACRAKQSGFGSGIDDRDKGKICFFNSLQGLLAQQGSVVTEVGSSSGAAQLECRPIQGSSTEFRSLARTISDLRGKADGSETENTSKQSGTGDEHDKKGETSKSSDTMPNVFTIGDGPDGRKVDGILYKYGRGEETQIMCVCHGSFFSPAEFVMHAGGHDIVCPLKHIVVRQSAPASQ